MLDLNDLKHRYVTGWGDRMTVGVEVGVMRELLEELSSLRDRHRLQTAALESAEVQLDYWHRMARAMSGERDKLALELRDLTERYSEPPPSGEQ